MPARRGTVEGEEARRLQFLGPRAIPWHGTPPAVLSNLRPAVVANDVTLSVQGRVAAATDGRVSLGADGGREPLRLAGHGAYRVLADTLAPVASAGDIVLVRPDGEPADGDLVIACVDGAVRARRVRWVDSEANCVVLLAAADSPHRAAAPIIAAPPRNNMLVIEGVLYGQAAVGGAGGRPDEAEELDSGFDLGAVLGRGGSVWEVSGDSASPVALDGQHLLVAGAAADTDRLARLDGGMVLAEVETAAAEPELYLKRLRWIPPLAVLESIDRGGAFPPVVCAVADGPRLPRLGKAAAVLGVLFSASGG